jgi:hypothetical protein
MSRFALIGAQETVVGGMRRRLRAGVVVADGAGSALAGDVICEALCAQPNRRLIPLDAAAVAAMQAVGISDAVVGVALSGPPTGADSIDA